MCVCNYLVRVLKRYFSERSDLLNYNRSESLAPFWLTVCTARIIQIELLV
jgi:hypothetical protein